MLPIHTILHPTDFSEASKPAFEMASALARDYRAKLVLLHVVPPVHLYAPDGIAVGFPPEQPYDAQVQLAKLRPDDPRVEVDHHVVDGDPVSEILKAAKTTNADVIVMGTHGNTGLTRLLVGSVAESVMRQAPCPVITVRGPFHVTTEAPPLIKAEPVTSGV
jgi:nucleotide-binding universal stress UspA family protein